jgi:hypothetical protein
VHIAVIDPRTIAYHDAVRSRYGKEKTDEIRLFMVLGVQHCSRATNATTAAVRMDAAFGDNRSPLISAALCARHICDRAPPS